MSHFYPRPPRGGRPCTTQNLLPRQKISIHALREEGDKLKNFRVKRPDRFLSTPSARRATGTCETRPTKLWKFLSTPSARRATADFTDPENTCPISIHALREEGDLLEGFLVLVDVNFYPRPPRGGRQKLLHRAVKAIEFLSTPSARRATSEYFYDKSGAPYFYPRPPRGGRRRCYTR